MSDMLTHDLAVLHASYVGAVNRALAADDDARARDLVDSYETEALELIVSRA